MYPKEKDVELVRLLVDWNGSFVVYRDRETGLTVIIDVSYHQICTRNPNIPSWDSGRNNAIL